jgi:Mrp family chromosome partitioning ATPase
VRGLLDFCRQRYEIVMVDTGPVLGSLEANYVCSVADGVVLVVGRGQSRTHVQRAIETLGSLKARVMGVVFNRAEASDFLRSATSASFRSVRDEPPSPPMPAGAIPDLEPVARTVAMDMRR